MSKDTRPQGVLFKGLSKQALLARFDQPDSSSDGVAILLKACDRKLGLMDAISRCIRDDRCGGKVRHSMRELISQRVYGIACGYEDCNDSARLRTDPVQRLLIDRDPLTGEALASQPTLSRLENGIDGRSLLGMGTAIMDTVIARHRKRLGKRVRRITLDLAPTAAPLMDEVRHRSWHSGETEHRYGECRYEARRWDDERRVIFKAEVLRHSGRDAKDNPRFVVTNLKTSPKHVYERVYCQRAVIENRIKELLLGLQIDRTRCTRFFANQFRVLLTVTAYVLLQELRLKARHTASAQAQVTTLRERLLKLAVWVEHSTRRIVFHLPNSAPWRSDWCRIARALGAVPI